jgi:HAD superfamily hydrolase (TIGR01509 family)
MRSLVIFDCDGVLVDSERLSHAVLREMLSEMGVHITFDETVSKFIGTAMPTCLALIAELTGASPPKNFLQTFASRTRQVFQRELTLVPGVQSVLDRLPSRYCVASNGNRAKVNFTLGHTGLLERFADRIFTAEDVLYPKPAPDLFLLAAQRMGTNPANATVVEDTPTGIAAAKAAGMRAIGFAAMTPVASLRSAGADAIATTMAEVGVLLRPTADA